MMTFAENSTGEGSFEGVEPELPEVTSLTLPTVDDGTYNYIADPAGLIRQYADDETKAKLPALASDTGIYFTVADTSEGASEGATKYSSDSTAITVTNHNARAIDLSVKVEVVTEDYDDLSFSESGTWESSDKANELYIAVKSGSDVEAVTDDAAAELKVPIEGTPDNYHVERTVTSGKATYAYVENEVEEGDDPLEWETASFNLTGAINKNAEWKDGTVTVPDVKVTWTVAAHVDGPRLATTAYTKSADNTPIVVAVSGLGAETIASVVCTDNSVDMLSNGFVTVSGANITFTSTYLGYIDAGDTYHYKATTSGGTELIFTVSGPTE